jgi:CRISPR/Cas system-associated endonuclease/helicase Cas3
MHMPVLKLFEQCEARPPVNGNPFLLPNHLLAVACRWGNINGNPESKIYFLAGLCHDMAKARMKWQDNLNGPRGSRPPHAAPSALVFTWYGNQLLGYWYRNQHISKQDRRFLLAVIVKAATDINDHHGSLSDICEDAPWRTTSLNDLAFDDLDWEGFHRFLSRFFPEIAFLPIYQGSMAREWILQSLSFWKKATPNLEKAIIYGSNQSRLSLDEARRIACIRLHTGRFIAADRIDAAQISETFLTTADSENAIFALEKYCQKRGKETTGSDPKAWKVVEKRIESQLQALKCYREDPNQSLWALNLPTGLGKTIASLRIALEACASGRCQRIIYAAPYISILSQATSEIQKSTGLDVLQHHHLSILSEEEFDERSILILESWQAPIVTTTFNQLFKALFPQRAQDTIRITAMEKAFIIIDEPQIMDSSIWNLFLAQLETAATHLDCQVMFVSATLPPFRYGISQHQPMEIRTNISMPSRFVMNYSDEIIDEDSVAERVIRAFKDSMCIVVNTVHDSCVIYKRVLSRLLTKYDGGVGTIEDMLDADDENESKNAVYIFNLNGLMTPIHKEFMIDVIKYCLIKKVRVCLISTQIVEAGVDLSFQNGLRCHAIAPSYSQFAGRVNRNGENKTIGNVDIVKFYRSGTDDSRKWVYNSKAETRATDEIFLNCKNWEEDILQQKIIEYYSLTFQMNRQTTRLNDFKEVSLGKWSLFAGIDPFEKSYPTITTFVPWPAVEVLNKLQRWYTKREEYLPGRGQAVRQIIKLMQKFNLRKVEEVYDNYVERGFLENLSFSEAKQYMALVQQFSVSVSNKLSSITCDPSEKTRAILRLLYADLYSIETGLGHHVGEEDQASFF